MKKNQKYLNWKKTFISKNASIEKVIKNLNETALQIALVVNKAFFIFDLMTDIWEGNTGSYLGKDWSSIEFLFDTYEVEDRPTVVYFLKSY